MNGKVPLRIRAFRDGEMVSYLLHDPDTQQALLIAASPALLGDYREALAEGRLVLVDLLQGDESSPTNSSVASLLRGERGAPAGAIRVRKQSLFWEVYEPVSVVFGDPLKVEGAKMSDGTPVFPFQAGVNDPLFSIWGKELEVGRFATISASKFQQKLRDESVKAAFIDVRESGEFDVSRISGMTNIPASELALHYKELVRIERVYLSCATGRRSRVAALTLAQAGVPDVVVVEGGLQSWTQSGLPIES